MWRLLTNRRSLQAAAVMAVLLTVALWPEAVDVEVGAVTRGAMVITINQEGETRVHHRFVVQAPFAGTLERLDLEPGNGVIKGETSVAWIMPDAPPPLEAAGRREAAAAVSAARAAVADARAAEQKARAALEQAAQELKREQALFDGGQTTQQSLEARRDLVVSGEETLNAAQYATAAAAAELDRAIARQAPARVAPAGKLVEVKAPVDGVVLTLFRQSEGPVAAGERLLEIGDPSHVEIVADVLATDAAKIKPGMRVDVEHWGGDTPLAAWVERVEPAAFAKMSARGVEEQRMTVLIDFEDDRAAWRAMGDGFRVEARIAIWEAGDVVRVPNSALVRDGDRWAVYVVQNGRARYTPLEIGQRTATEAEVIKGLASGQQVVIRPPDALTDNARVVVRK
jgi:HlyD family secretion protein